MNDPHSHAQKTGCGCSGKRTVEPAAVAHDASVGGSCCSGSAKADPAPVEHHHQAGAHGCCSGSKAGDTAATVKERWPRLSEQARGLDKWIAAG